MDSGGKLGRGGGFQPPNDSILFGQKNLLLCVPAIAVNELLLCKAVLGRNCWSKGVMTSLPSDSNLQYRQCHALTAPAWWSKWVLIIYSITTIVFLHSTRSLLSSITLQEHQMILTNAELSKVSDTISQWWAMGN